MKKLILLFALCFVAPALAQERPIAGTTLQSTDTSANSLLIGCAVGSTTCTGGIKVGAIVGSGDVAINTNKFTVTAASGNTLAAGTLAWGGGSAISSSNNVAVLNAVNTFTAFGAHTWSSGGVTGNTLNLVNTTAGTGAFARILIGNDVDPALGRLQVSSSTFTTAGPLQPNVLSITSDGGLNIGTNAALSLGLYSNNLLRWGVNAAGDFTFGPTPIIYLSSGTPALTSGFGVGSGASIAGTDNAFQITLGSVASTTGLVTFGHTMSGAVCVATGSTAALTASLGLPTTAGASVTINYTSSASLKIYMMCHGVT